MRILIWVLLIYLAYRMIRGKKAPAVRKEEPGATETFRDPVCGVYVSEADAVVGSMEGKRYYFCSLGCLQEFEKNQQQR